MLRIFFSVFGAILFAEFADKTQIVGLSMSAKSGKPLLVWLASVSAYSLVTFISVLVGAALSRYLKPDIIRYISGAIFIFIGLLILARKI